LNVIEEKMFGLTASILSLPFQKQNTSNGFIQPLGQYFVNELESARGLTLFTWARQDRERRCHGNSLGGRGREVTNRPDLVHSSKGLFDIS
jgi:hypothetical protein